MSATAADIPGPNDGGYLDAMSALLDRRPVGRAVIRLAFDAIFAGAWTPVQVAAFCIALRMVGEDAETLVAAAEAMRSTMHAVEHRFERVVDTCGTGGDGAHTLNVSSGAAVVVAACGLPVAKHGNRSASSRCGSADVFEALGIPLDLPPGRQAEVLAESGIAFLFAQAHHPAMRHAAQARRELKTRTVFNALGPMANPARPTHQLVGVYDDALRPLVARALGVLGARRAWVVRGVDGLDEVSPCGPTRVTELTPAGAIVELTLTPEEFGIRPLAREALAGGAAEDNARALLAIVDGEAHPAREAIVLNAAAALVVATAESYRTCADRARRALDDGAARRTLDHWRRVAARVRSS